MDATISPSSPAPPPRAPPGCDPPVASLWPNIAHCWDLLASPLRPAPEDLVFYSAEIRQWSQARGAPRVLLLGVTPELYNLPWPAGTDLLAVDRSQPMIDHVWPGPRDRVCCADWQTLDLPAASRDIALCDGGLHLLSYPAGQTQLVRTLARVVAPGGLILLRLYTPPAVRESPRRVLDDLLAGRISNLNVFKVRLNTALQNDAAEGVKLADAWDAFNQVAPDQGALARRLGWSPTHTQVINLYHHNPTRYHFVTQEQTAALFCRDPGGFELLRVHVPTYELGGQCPLLVLRRL
jgi:SAM-dependent methyltransferase